MFNKNKANASTTTLVLKPTDRHLEQVTITSPFFSIGKSERFISQYADDHAFEVSCVSSKHAVISYENDQYVLRDLGSSNGTLVNDKELVKDEAVVLGEGDIVTFGNQLFCYQVALTKTVAQNRDSGADKKPRSKPGSPQRKGQHNPPAAKPAQGTAYIGKSSVDEIIDQIISDDGGSSLKIEDLGQTREKITVSPLRKFAMPLLGGAFILALVLALLVFLYLGRNSEFNKIEQLLADKNYASALQSSSRNLLDSEQSISSVSRFENFAQEAFIGLVSPEWINYIDRGDYLSAREYPQQILGQQQQATAIHLAPIVDVLSWITDLFRENQSGVSVSVYQSSSTVMDLMRGWQQKKSVYLALMRRIETRAPTFAPVHRKVVSSVRDLQVQVEEIGNSKDRVFAIASRVLRQPEDKAATGQLQALLRSTPELLESDRFIDELTLYKDTFSAEHNGCFGLALALSDSAFEHPLILEQTNALKDRTFGTSGDLNQVLRALLEWRRGAFSNARELLSTSQCNPVDGRNSEQEIERIQSIVDLLGSGSDDDMLTVYQLLDEKYDSYYLERYQDRIIDTRQSAEQEMQRLSTEAIDGFAQYQSSGGISPAMRISERLTDNFQQQATRLSGALASAAKATNIARIININLASGVLASFRDMQDEAKNQTGFLEELRSSFANRVVLDKKIELLKAWRE